MSRTIDLLFAVTGQSLYFDAPEGRPSSVTSSQVFENTTGDDGDAETATTGSAAVETNPNTTFNAASGDGQTNPQICNLTTTTGIGIGRGYRITNAAGEWEWIEVVGATATTATAREPLANAYTTGDTFVSTRITHAIDATWVADKTNLSDACCPNARYRWRLVYVVGGVTYVHDAYFDLLRYAGRHDVTAADVARRSPGWTQRVATYHREDQGRAIIDEAYEVVKFDLYNFETPDQSIRNREARNEMVLLKAIELVDPTELNVQRYSERLQQFMAGAKLSVQADTSGAATTADVRPLWRR